MIFFRLQAVIVRTYRQVRRQVSMRVVVLVTLIVQSKRCVQQKTCQIDRKANFFEREINDSCQYYAKKIMVPNIYRKVLLELRNGTNYVSSDTENN